MEQFKAALLAAGLGTRLKNIAKQIPKCLIRIGGKTILEHQISALKNYGVNEIFLVIGTKGGVWNQDSYEVIREITKREKLKMILNFENDTTHNSYSLLLAMKEMEETALLAIDGDLFFGNRMLSLTCENPYEVVIVSKKTNDLSEPGTRVVVDEDGKVVDLGKNMIPSTPSWHIHSGLIKINEAYFDRFKRIVSKEEYTSMDLSHPLKEFTEKYELYSLEMNDGWTNVNTPADLRQAKLLWKRLK